jgi:hypothetical protein
MSSQPTLDLGLKAKYSFYSTLVFFLIANPLTYKFTQAILTPFQIIKDREGNPTTVGFFIHAVLFFFTILALMMFPKD